MRVHALELGRVEDRPIQAHAQISAAALRYDTTKAGTEAARHTGLQGELGWGVRIRAQRSYALEHAGRPTGVDDRVRVALDLRGEQLGDEPVVAEGAIVGGDTCAVQQHRALRTAPVAKAEQHDDIAALRLLGEGVL